MSKETTGGETYAPQDLWQGLYGDSSTPSQIEGLTIQGGSIR
jgi:hypothetical protein